MNRVAAVQFKPRKGDVSGSRGRLVRLAERASERADLVVLPEMAATGYVFPTRESVAAVAEPADGPTLAALAPIARAHHTWLVAGFPEIDGARLYNSALVIDPTGELVFVYRKTLLYDEDLHWATPGDSGYRVFEADGVRFTVGICMDLNDDAFVDWIHDQDVDLVAFPTNWVKDDSDIDLYTYWAWRLGHARAALVAANTWGRDGHVEFSGRSAILEQRTILGHLAPTGDGIVAVPWRSDVKAW